MAWSKACGNPFNSKPPTTSHNHSESRSFPTTVPGRLLMAFFSGEDFVNQISRIDHAIDTRKDKQSAKQSTTSLHHLYSFTITQKDPGPLLEQGRLAMAMSFRIRVLAIATWFHRLQLSPIPIWLVAISHPANIS